MASSSLSPNEATSLWSVSGSLAMANRMASYSARAASHRPWPTNEAASSVRASAIVKESGGAPIRA